MQLWPATIASPPSTRRKLMACLIIVGLHRGKQRVAEGSRTQTGLVVSAGSACGFFCGEGLPASVSIRRIQSRVGLTDIPWEEGLGKSSGGKRTHRCEA